MSTTDLSMIDLKGLEFLFDNPAGTANLQTILDAIPSAIALIDASGKIIYVNARRRELFGINNTEVNMEAHISQVNVLYPDGTPAPLKKWPVSHSLESGQVVRNVEMIIQNINGMKRPVIASSSPLRDNNGNIKGAIVIFEDFTERKRAEEALQERSFASLDQVTGRLNALMESLPAGVWIADAEGQIIMTNKAAAEIYGGRAPLANCIKEYSVYKVFWPDTTQPIPVEEYPLSKSINGETVKDMVMDYERFDGTRGTQLASSTPIRNANGNVVGAVVIAMDITELKEAENALRIARDKLERLVQERTDELQLSNDELKTKIIECKRAEDALREKAKQLEKANLQREDILESIYDCFYALDKDLRFTYVNKAAEEIWDISRDDLIGRRIADVFAGLIDISLSKFHQVLEEQTPQHYEVFSKVTGKWGNMGVYPTSDGVSVYFWDTTERKQVEEALRESEESKAFLLKLSDAIRPLYDAELIQRTTTRLLSEHLGASQSNYTEYYDDFSVMRRYNINGNIPSKGILRHEDYPSGVAILRSGRDLVISDVLIFSEFPEEERIHWAKHNIRANISVPLIKDDRLVATFSVKQATPRDWTPNEVEFIHETAERTWAAVVRARAEEALRRSEERAQLLIRELEEADKNKNLFIRTLSHELRNPLATIFAGIDFMDVTDDQQQLKKAKVILKRQIRHLTKLIDDLLDVSRISQNKITLKKEYIILNETVHDIVEDLKPQFEKQDVQLHTVIREHPIILYADPVRITQLIENILTNALKFTQRGDTVWLTLTQEIQNAILVIKDNGAGIDPVILPKIFEPFMQAEQALDRCDGGLGLGLSIAKSIVELHGGNLTAYSAGLEKGSEFIIRLPVLEARE